MAGQKACLVQEPGDSIHLNKVLDVAFLQQSLLGNLEFLVAVEVPSTLDSATRSTAAAQALEVGYQGVEEVARLEVLLLLDLGPQSVFGGPVSRRSIGGLL